MTAETETAARPWFMGPLPGFVLIVGSLIMLLHDGIQPYRILWRRSTWKKVPATRATVSVPYRRVALKPGVGQRDPNFQRGQRSRLSVENQAAMSGKRRGKRRRRRRGIQPPPHTSRATPSGTDGSRVINRKVLPREIHSKYIKKGVLFPHKAKVWYVTLAYSYQYKGKVYTILDDTPPFTFENQAQAIDFMRKRTRQWPIKIWVNPSSPKRATAFLEYRNWLWIRIGGAVFLAGLIWMLLAAASGRKPPPPTPEEVQEKEPADEARSARPRRRSGAGDPRGRPRSL